MKRNASRILLAALVVMLCVRVAVSHPPTQSTTPSASTAASSLVERPEEGGSLGPERLQHCLGSN